eukprot:403345435
MFSRIQNLMPYKQKNQHQHLSPLEVNGDLFQKRRCISEDINDELTGKGKAQKMLDKQEEIDCQTVGSSTVMSEFLNDLIKLPEFTAPDDASSFEDAQFASDNSLKDFKAQF